WLSLETAAACRALSSGGARFIFDASDHRGVRSVVLHRSSPWDRESLATMSHRVSSPPSAARAADRPHPFRSDHMASGAGWPVSPCRVCAPRPCGQKIRGPQRRGSHESSTPYTLNARSYGMAVTSTGGISSLLAECSEVPEC